MYKKTQSFFFLSSRIPMPSHHIDELSMSPTHNNVVFSLLPGKKHTSVRSMQRQRNKNEMCRTFRRPNDTHVAAQQHIQKEEERRKLIKKSYEKRTKR